MKLIDKAAVVAEIKRLIRANELYLSEPETDEVRFQKAGAYSVLNDLLHFLDTLEVREMNLEKEIDDYVNEPFSECDDGVLISDANSKELTLLDITPLAKHFYSLGLKAQKGK